MNVPTTLRAHTRLAAFALLVLLQAAVVIGLVVREERIRATGRVVVLKAAPVDPRDLLRGDYVTLRYDIENVPTYYARYGGRASAGEQINVILRRNGHYWEVTEYTPATSDSPAPAAGDVFLRGTVESLDANSSRIRVSYANLDRFYVPEGTGRLPKPPDAVVVIDRDGSARIRGLEIDGKPWPGPAR